ncbi:MAG: N-acetylmuramoyl-L-alanine amidase [Eubacterium sp.]|jgi:N-acetylmuramoyl-L-alanine amidase|nr:N-acetylmuramoyl-L-alanine amidase [Eubacterium sp.]
MKLKRKVEMLGKLKGISLILALSLYMVALPFCIGAEPASSNPEGIKSNQTNISSETQIINESNFKDNESFSMISLPENMRGVILTPGRDFILSEENDENDVSSQIENILEKLSETGLNTVVINTAGKSGIYYDLSMNKTDKPDFLSLTIEKAHEKLFNVFLVYDINNGLKDAGSSGSGAINKLVSEVHRFSIKYPGDGIILDDYYNKKNADSYGRYMINGSGIGYENWLYDSTEYLFETASRVIRLTDNSIPVGIMINDVWANNSDNKQGSSTGDKIQALYDGFSDTKKYVENGYTDFLMVRSYGSIDDKEIGFSDVTGWWSELCQKANVPMYIVHYNEKIGSSETGWGAEDQLLKQLVKAKETEWYQGSVFNSYESLLKNPLNSTDTLTKYYENQINEESLNEELTMRSPKDLKFTTYEKTVNFAGSFDENFDVYFNDKKIKLNEAGNFYFEKTLNVGKNVFTIRHKSKIYTYQIEHKIITMRDLDESIAEGKILRVDGGTSLTLSAVAYQGATVTATIGEKTVALKESGRSGDEDINSSYVTFSGKYNMPEGIIETEQNLGIISVNSVYQGYSRTLAGASVIVNALPKPPEALKTMMFDQDSLGTGEVVGTISPFKTDQEMVKYIKVINNNTHVFDGKTIGTSNNPAFNPAFGQVPAGTLDYLKSANTNFYTTLSGKRFYSSDVTTFEDTGLGENRLVVKAGGTYSGDSYFKIGLDYKISYKAEVVGQSYYSSDDYAVSNFGSANYVYITFDNITSVTKLPDFESNLVFDSGKWEQVTEEGIAKFRMILRLRQQGVYGGCNAYYDDNGDLMLTFQVLTNTIQNMNVVIDPGHGYGKSPSKLDPGAIGEVIEYDVNLAIAKKLDEKLRAIGVNSVRLQTENQFVLTKSRPEVARDSYGCDLFISLHANWATGGGSVRGTEVYYYNPFSQPLAEDISASISNYFSNNVYQDKANENRGAKYTYFNVTLQPDFPSVLVETGFVNNMEDAMALANPKHQDGIANAIINGISSYLSKSSISYSSNGSVAIPDNNENFDENGGGTTETMPAETEPYNESADDPAEGENPIGDIYAQEYPEELEEEETEILFY